MCAAGLRTTFALDHASSAVKVFFPELADVNAMDFTEEEAAKHPLLWQEKKDVDILRSV